MLSKGKRKKFDMDHKLSGVIVVKSCILVKFTLKLMKNNMKKYFNFYKKILK